MPRCVFQDDQLAIFDDVLPQREFESFWTMFCNSDFEMAHARGVRGFFRPSDGIPYVGGDIAWAPDAVKSEIPEGVSLDDLPVRIYPTGLALDRVIDQVLALAPTRESLLGRLGSDWVGIVCKLYAYPANTSIAWHTDDVDFTGSFIFYANPHWSPAWGGELLVADSSTRNRIQRSSVHGFGKDRAHEVLLERGHGRYVMPKPNRLVLLGGGHPHMVAKVRADAGDHVRASLSGFLVNPKRLRRLIEEALGEKR